jgi:hypothetical protein
MVEYKRDPEGLKQAVREHSIHDYPLTVPIFGQAKGIGTSSIRGLTSVLVEPIKPLPFSEVATLSMWDAAKHDLEYWLDYGKRRYPQNPLGWMHPHSVAMLEDGYPISMQDVKRAWLKVLGHIDSNDIIRRYSFNLDEVSTESDFLYPGMIVDFYDKKSQTSVTGRVYGKDRDPQDGTEIVYLETFAPVPALLAPKAISPWMLNNTMISDKTWALGYGTVMAMKKKRVKIPKGMYDPKDEGKRVYYLDQPIPIRQVQEFCEKYYPGEQACSWQSMVFMLLPLHPWPDKAAKKRHEGGSFHPYPDDVSPTEVEAEIDYFTEGMEFEE